MGMQRKESHDCCTKTAAAMMTADKITAAQRACEEAYMQSGAPDYRSLYFKLFGALEEIRKLLEQA